MIRIKSQKDIEMMREGGIISREILDNALRMCVPGVTTLEIDAYVSTLINKNGVKGWFKEVNDYKYDTCIAVNEVWLHAIPNQYVLKDNDVVSIDIGIIYEGYYLDNCWTVVVKDSNKKEENIRKSIQSNDISVTKFLETGVEALNNAIEKAIVGNHIGDISNAMGSTVNKEGYSTIKDFVGHGVGYTMHEEPQIFCNGTKGAGPDIKDGMVLAIEIMYAMGKNEHIRAKDGWSIITKDNKLSAMFEHTVAVTKNGPIILT